MWHDTHINILRYTVHSTCAYSLKNNFTHTHQPMLFKGWWNCCRTNQYCRRGSYLWSVYIFVHAFCANFSYWCRLFVTTNFFVLSVFCPGERTKDNAALGVLVHVNFTTLNLRACVGKNTAGSPESKYSFFVVVNSCCIPGCSVCFAAFIAVIDCDQRGMHNRWLWAVASNWRWWAVVLEWHCHRIHQAQGQL